MVLSKKAEKKETQGLTYIDRYLGKKKNKFKKERKKKKKKKKKIVRNDKGILSDKDEGNPDLEFYMQLSRGSCSVVNCDLIWQYIRNACILQSCVSSSGCHDHFPIWKSNYT